MNRFYFLLLIILFLFFNKSHAQYKKNIVSTGLNFSKTMPEIGTLLNERTVTGEKKITITPRWVFRINKVWAFGAVYQYSRTNQKLTEAIYIPSSNDNSNLLYIALDSKTIYQHGGLLVQNYLYDNGKIAAFLEIDGIKGNSKTEARFPEGLVVSSSSIKTDVYASGLHAGGRYHFFKDFGIEARINGLIQYQYFNTKEMHQKTTEFKLFDNIWDNCSIGLFYQL